MLLSASRAVGNQGIKKKVANGQCYLVHFASMRELLLLLT